jgi:hypothetical protein
MAYLLATLAQFKTFQKGEVPSSLDTAVTQILQGVTVRFAGHCRRQTWDKALFTEYFSHRQPQRGSTLLSFQPPQALDAVLYVKHPPIDPDEDYALYDDPARVFGDAAMIPTTDYVVEAEAGRIELDGRWFQPGLQSTKFRYTGGYLTDDGTSAAPRFPDLQLLCLMQATFVYQRRAEMGLTGRSLEGGSITFQSQLKLLPEVEDGLRAFRMARIG